MSRRPNHKPAGKLDANVGRVLEHLASWLFVLIGLRAAFDDNPLTCFAFTLMGGMLVYPTAERWVPTAKSEC